jgi:hypothetical protein
VIRTASGRKLPADRQNGRGELVNPLCEIRDRGRCVGMFFCQGDHVEEIATAFRRTPPGLFGRRQFQHEQIRDRRQSQWNAIDVYGHCAPHGILDPPRRQYYGAYRPG